MHIYEAMFACINTLFSLLFGIFPSESIFLATKNSTFQETKKKNIIKIMPATIIHGKNNNSNFSENGTKKAGNKMYPAVEITCPAVFPIQPPNVDRANSQNRTMA